GQLLGLGSTRQSLEIVYQPPPRPKDIDGQRAPVAEIDGLPSRKLALKADGRAQGDKSQEPRMHRGDWKLLAAQDSNSPERRERADDQVHADQKAADGSGRVASTHPPPPDGERCAAQHPKENRI